MMMQASFNENEVWLMIGETMSGNAWYNVKNLDE